MELADECDRFEEPERMATLGAPPLRIDIMNYIDGVAFEDAWKGRLKATFGDHPVSFLGIEALRANKLAAGRPKDMADLALIEEMSRSSRTAGASRMRATPASSGKKKRTKRPR